jgi:hypothetical protein
LLKIKLSEYVKRELLILLLEDLHKGQNRRRFCSAPTGKILMLQTAEKPENPV